MAFIQNNNGPIIIKEQNNYDHSVHIDKVVNINQSVEFIKEQDSSADEMPEEHYSGDAAPMQKAIPAPDLPKEILEAPKKIFVQTSIEFVKSKVIDAAAAYCTGKPYMYAYLMTTCYDHNLITDRTAYLEFTRALAAWGIITDFSKITTISNSIGKKMKTLNTRYRSWPESKDKKVCMGIAEIFGETIYYRN